MANRPSDMESDRDPKDEDALRGYDENEDFESDEAEDEEDLIDETDEE
jgi:hypothetical protein